MSEAKELRISSDYDELVACGRPRAQLDALFTAALGLAARKEYGSGGQAAAFLGVHRDTVYEWPVAARAFNFSEELMATANRLAVALLAREYVENGQQNDEKGETTAYQWICTAFHIGLAEAAVHAAGNKGKAARLLKVHRNWVSYYTTRRAA